MLRGTFKLGRSSVSKSLLFILFKATRPRSFSLCLIDGASCLPLFSAVHLSKESQRGGELLAASGGALSRAASIAAVALKVYLSAAVCDCEVGFLLVRLFARELRFSYLLFCILIRFDCNATKKQF